MMSVEPAWLPVTGMWRGAGRAVPIAVVLLLSRRTERENVETCSAASGFSAIHAGQVATLPSPRPLCRRHSPLQSRRRDPRPNEGGSQHYERGTCSQRCSALFSS